MFFVSKIFEKNVRSGTSTHWHLLLLIQRSLFLLALLTHSSLWRRLIYLGNASLVLLIAAANATTGKVLGSKWERQRTHMNTHTYFILHMLLSTFGGILRKWIVSGKGSLDCSTRQRFNLVDPLLVAHRPHVVLQRQLRIVERDDRQEHAEEGQFAKRALLWRTTHVKLLQTVVEWPYSHHCEKTYEHHWGRCEGRSI